MADSLSQRYLFLQLHVQCTECANHQQETVASCESPQLRAPRDKGQEARDKIGEGVGDGFHCLGSAGTEPVVLKVVPVTGAACSDFTMDQ